MVEAVAEEADWDLPFVEAPFDSLLPARAAGRIAAIANQVTSTPERAARHLVSTSYAFSKGVIVTAADTDDITSPEELEGRKAAQTATSNWSRVFRARGGAR